MTFIDIISVHFFNVNQKYLLYTNDLIRYCVNFGQLDCKKSIFIKIYISSLQLYLDKTKQTGIAIHNKQEIHKPSGHA